MTSDADRIQDLLDREELGNLVAEIADCVDRKDFDGLSRVFAADATLETPGGVSTGAAAIVDLARRNHENYAQTQHLVAGTTIALHGDRATVGANVVAVFVPNAGEPAVHRMIGCRYAFDAARTTHGWRFTSQLITPIWDRHP
ncbi:nuclear transport factor 2 family protein [Nocardia sp. NPDC051052]|uniref:nuclear transport factor 2 family protein n=1 Tax=Nocardia sp. NPDC051052 TaxID=3364322 RepID=UPI0037BACAB6